MHRRVQSISLPPPDPHGNSRDPILCLYIVRDQSAVLNTFRSRGSRLRSRITATAPLAPLSFVGNLVSLSSQERTAVTSTNTARPAIQGLRLNT
jgi:hypothetical protein